MKNRVCNIAITDRKSKFYILIKKLLIRASIKSAESSGSGGQINNEIAQRVASAVVRNLGKMPYFGEYTCLSAEATKGQIASDQRFYSPNYVL